MFCKTALYIAVKKENIKIIKYLLTNDGLDINIPNILNIFYRIQNHIFNIIQNHIFQKNSKSYLSMKLIIISTMKFKIIYFNDIRNRILLIKFTIIYFHNIHKYIF